MDMNRGVDRRDAGFDNLCMRHSAQQCGYHEH
jgi:hypothetical protein